MKQKLIELNKTKDILQKAIRQKNGFFSSKKFLKKFYKIVYIHIFMCYIDTSKANSSLKFITLAQSTDGKSYCISHLKRNFIEIENFLLSFLFRARVQSKKQSKSKKKEGLLFMSKYFIEATQNNNVERFSNLKVTKLRSIKETMQELNQLDPATALTTYHIRCLCSANKIKHLRTGKKILVNFDSLLNYMKGE